MFRLAAGVWPCAAALPRHARAPPRTHRGHEPRPPGVPRAPAMFNLIECHPLTTHDNDRYTFVSSWDGHDTPTATFSPEEDTGMLGT